MMNLAYDYTQLMLYCDKQLMVYYVYYRLEVIEQT